MGNLEHEMRASLTGNVCSGDRCLKVEFPSICRDCVTLPVAAPRQQVKENFPNGTHTAHKKKRSFKLLLYPMQHKNNTNALPRDNKTFVLTFVRFNKAPSLLLLRTDKSKTATLSINFLQNITFINLYQVQEVLCDCPRM